MRSSMFMTGAALALLLAGCGDDKKDPAPSAGTSSAAAQKPGAAAAAPSAAKPAAVAGNDEIPSEADFEEEAEREITGDNLESELAKLEQEIGN